MGDSYCIENDFAAQKELAEKYSANIDEQWKDRLEFNALSLRAERAEAKLSLWQKDMNEVLRQRDDLLTRAARLEEFLARMVYADRWTWEKDGTDIFEAFRTDARTILEAK